MRTSRRIGSSFITTGAAVLISLLIAVVIIALTSESPLQALWGLLVGPLQSTRKIGLVVQTSIPVIFTGLAFSVMFQARQFNLAVDGIFYFSAAMAALFGIQLRMVGGLHPAVIIVLCAVIGALISILPAALSIRWNANIIVSSLMLNYVLQFGGLYLLRNVIRDSASGNMVSMVIGHTAKLPELFPRTGIHLGAVLAAVAIVVCYLFVYKTRQGYEVRMVGHNPAFCRYTGMNVTRVLLLAQLIGGGLAGMGGAVEIEGVYNRFEWLINPGYGWSGFIAATLAKNNPAFVPLAALFLSYLSVGSDVIVRTCGVPPDVIPTIRGIMIVLIASESFLSEWKHRRMVRQMNEAPGASGK